MVVRYQYIYFLYLTNSHLVTTSLKKFQYKYAIRTKSNILHMCSLLYIKNVTFGPDCIFILKLFLNSL